MSAHTPGPWMHYDDTAGKTGRHEIVALGRTVARIYYADEQGAADARLIAAAPDLLKALQDIMNAKWTPHGMSEEHADAARAAYVKATGEQP